MSGEHPAAVRIASLVPSLTELVVALGLGDRLVARTGWCIHPAAALARVPKVGGTKTVNLAKLRRLAPTHVLVNVDENRRETVEAIRAWGAAAPEIVVTHPLGARGQPGAGRHSSPRCSRGPAEVAARADALSAALARELAATRPEGRPELRVLYLIWHDPWMTVARDTYLSRMLARIGWRTLPAVEGGAAGAARYPPLVGDEPWLGSVERVLLSSEPFAFDAPPCRRGAGALPGRQGPAGRRRAAQLVRRPRRGRTGLPAGAGRRQSASRTRLSAAHYRLPMEVLKPLLALLAIVNPIGVIPFFIHFTRGFSREQRRRTIHVAAHRRLRRHRRQRPGRAAHHRVLRHLAGLVPGRRRHAAAGVGAADAQRPAGREPQRRPERRQRQGRRRRLDRDRAADDSAADRAGDDLDHGHLRREDAALVAARDPGRLRRRHRPVGLARVQPLADGSPGCSAAPASTS